MDPRPQWTSMGSFRRGTSNASPTTPTASASNVPPAPPHNYGGYYPQVRTTLGRTHAGRNLIPQPKTRLCFTTPLQITSPTPRFVRLHPLPHTRLFRLPHGSNPWRLSIPGHLATELPGGEAGHPRSLCLHSDQPEIIMPPRRDRNAPNAIPTMA